MTNATIVIYIHKKKGPERKKKFSTVNMTRPVKWVNKTNTTCTSYRGLFTSEIYQNSQFCELLSDSNSYIHVQLVAI